MYAVTAAAPVEIAPTDSTHINAGVHVFHLPSVLTLASLKATDNPIVDPRYFTTESDRAVIRASMRRALQAMKSSVMREPVEGEVAPLDMPSISSTSSDTEGENRINATSWSWYHASGTASMCKVVDSHCRIYDVGRLGVVDTSIIPLSLTAHLQAFMYATAESAAALIAQGSL